MFVDNDINRDVDVIAAVSACHQAESYEMPPGI